MLNVKRTNSFDGHFNALISLLDKDLRQRYGPIQDAYDPYNIMDDIDTVVVVYMDEQPAGCGCFKKHDDESIEIKRMYVDVAFRRMGIGKTVINELEQWAKELGYTSVVLETGKRQPESYELYKSCGYAVIPNYEPYMEMVESVCFGKKLI